MLALALKALEGMRLNQAHLSVQLQYYSQLGANAVLQGFQPGKGFQHGFVQRLHKDFYSVQIVVPIWTL